MKITSVLSMCTDPPRAFGRNLHNLMLMFGVAAAFAISGAVSAQCPPGEIEDCCGNCAPANWVGDGWCDDGAFTWGGIPIYFNCPEFNCDGGDCTDCSGCPNGDPGPCPPGQIEDCCGNCAPASWLGDNDCDAGQWSFNGNPIYFNCFELNCDNGDCTANCDTAANVCGGPGDPVGCDGFCNGQSPDGCWCDDGCFNFADCCDGICDDCPNLSGCDTGPVESECDGFCNGQAPSGCWCDSSCCTFLDCCCNAGPVCGLPCNIPCPETCDPADFPPNNDCANADFAPAPLGPGSSHTFTGNNLCATHDCASFPSGEGHVWIAFELTQAGSVGLSYCGSVNASGGSFGNAWINAAIGCPCSDFTAAASFAWSCPDGNVELTWGNLPAGTYYYPVMLDSANGANGDYQITVSVLGDAVGCEGICNSQSPAGCWCDSSCFTFADCCPDICDHCSAMFPDQCQIGEAGCDGFCGGQSPDGCWCDSSCPDFSDCCDNFCDFCEHLDPDGVLCDVDPADPEGCSLGFWKNHTGVWSGYSPDDQFCEVFFGDDAPGGECAGNCVGQAASGCWCDNSCFTFVDCCDGICDDCPDLANCAGAAGPCAGFCGGFNSTLGCWCDNSCITFGDCCDMGTICTDCPTLPNCGGAAGDAADACPFGSATLHEVLSQSSGGGTPHARNLGKQAVAALLNAAAGMSYPLTEDEVKDAVAAAFTAWADGAHSSVLTELKDALDANNNLGCPEFAQADLNQDATVNVFDMLLVLSAWGQTRSPADINRDGAVNVFDLLEVLANWGPAPVQWEPGPGLDRPVVGQALPRSPVKQR